MHTVCFAADFKDKCGFFGFRVIQRDTRNGKSLSIKFKFAKKEMTYNAIAIVNKNLVNRTVSFENELVPLNGRIQP